MTKVVDDLIGLKVTDEPLVGLKADHKLTEYGRSELQTNPSWG